jgi:peptidoglycan/xylan/chitin deacetylase (PgdA/CDA1 family)
MTGLPPTRVVFYHSIGRPHAKSGAMIAPPEALESHVGQLRDLGYRFATARELAEAWAREGAPPAGVAVLTFDDGWRDGLTTVTPLLAGLGIQATFYVCPQALGKSHRLVGPGRAFLTDEEARELHDAGMELGSHTMGHHNVLELSDDDLRWELERSREYLGGLTGTACRTLAYPTGRHDPRVERAARDAGYEVAFACEPGPWERYAAPRWHAPVVDDPARFVRKLGLEALMPGG